MSMQVTPVLSRRRCFTLVLSLRQLLLLDAAEPVASLASRCQRPCTNHTCPPPPPPGLTESQGPQAEAKGG